MNKFKEMGSSENHHLDGEACVNALLFLSSAIFPRVLHAATELDLFGIIAKAGPGAYVSASEIASQLPTKNPDAPFLLDRILHLFATHSLLSYSPRTVKDGKTEKTYALTPSSKFFIGSVEDGNLSCLYKLSHHKAAIEVWSNMKDVILEGGSLFKKVHGMSNFEYMNEHSEFNTIFNQAMAARSRVVMNAILDVYKGFDGLSSLVDVGGGTGASLHVIISKYPSIQGINFDLPHVIQSAPLYPGIEHVGGNMLASVPKGDAIMMKNTCHDWADEIVIKVLKIIYQVLPNKGKLIIMDALLPEKPETSKASQYVSILDTVMMAQLSGKERTAREFEALTLAAGFTNFHVACIAHGVWGVMESYKL